MERRSFLKLIPAVLLAPLGLSALTEPAIVEVKGLELHSVSPVYAPSITSAQIKTSLSTTGNSRWIWEAPDAFWRET